MQNALGFGIGLVLGHSSTLNEFGQDTGKTETALRAPDRANDRSPPGEVPARQTAIQSY